MYKAQKPLATLRSSLLSFFLLAMACGLLTGCDLASNQLKHDRAANMDFQDFRDGMAPRPEPENTKYEEGIPSLQSYVMPPSENLRPMPLVSISVNQTVPLRDALFELAKAADYDIELDPNISGSVIFTARNKPFDEVVERISDAAGLRYKLEDGVLRIEEDTPYAETYKIDYVNFIRKTSSTIDADMSVVEAQGAAGASGGSGFMASNSSEVNFWSELDTNLQQILQNFSSLGLRTSSTPSIQVMAAPAPIQPVVATPAVLEDGETAPNVVVSAPTAQLQVNSLPSVSGTQPSGNAPPAATFSINKQAGLINVFATDKAHREISEYLAELRRSVTAQVLIEAKVLEVSLDDEFATGVNWEDFSFGAHNKAKVVGDLNFDTQTLFSDTPFNTATGALNIFAGGSDVGATIQALSRFGTVRALSSPRVTVLNNQSALMNVTTNLVYFELDVSINQSDSTITTNVQSEIKSVPEGVIINVQPSIDLVNRKISMALRPTITKVEGFEEDPGIPITVAAFLASAGGAVPADLVDELEAANSRVPILGVQEFDSVIEVNSGEAIVIGGLMQDKAQTQESGVPVLAEVPLVGNLFKAHSDRIEKTELVIFLKAQIIDGGYMHDTDKQLYRTYATDRRPWKL